MKNIKNIYVIASIFFAALLCSCSLNPAEEASEPIVVNFPDPNFEALIREVLNIPDGEITNQDMWTITKLTGGGREINDISGIEYCSGLTILTLYENFIINIDLLSDLVLLNHVDIRNNLIMDIKPLIDNIGIGIGNDAIYLNDNPLSDESIFQYKPQLQAKGISVYSNATPSSPGVVNIIDVNFEIILREHLNKLNGDILNTDLELITKIDGRNRNIQSIYGIEFCTNLDTLDIGYNGITDLIPLFYLRKMKSLKLDYNFIEDISSLKLLFLLTDFVISNNKISDLLYISNLINLTYLSLDNNKLIDISPLSNLINLNYLKLSNNPIETYESISGIDSLKTLEILNSQQFNFHDIKDIKNLQTLYLTNTPVINLEPIANITSLQNLIMKNCSLSNIDSLANLNKLRKLFLNENYIEDITSLAGLYELIELDLRNNNISDILPLIDNWGIYGGNDYVYLNNNPLNEISLNTYIPLLQDRGIVLIY